MIGPFYVKETKNAKIVEVELPVSKINWSVIDLFKTRFSILKENLSDLELKKLSFNIRKSERGFYSGKIEPLPSEYRLKGLYLDFRPFHHKKEKISVTQICKHLMSLNSSKEYLQFILEEKQKFESASILNGFIFHKGHKVSANELIDLWFYSYYFHFNRFPQLKKWQKYFADETFQSLLFLSVYESINILRKIHWSISDLTPTNLLLKIPKPSQK
ncbi:MAG: hypothetical protein A2499_18265 [Stygiobacter sp. RIFOXYC12_FULL_38_8]|nr:MAG: hypothetical protein A2X62_03865 [Stygiobacter sp. GWC2_38_9]OGV09738.1 MAG: hypothetical protein A2299_14430 [Stygiobacter sp. RIFOXYB2_FULL_37_11]OGV13605.1 MAG: hypothetical protein A2440_10565 [Stygiobacter sp. RIFOXYC2_FULL_38_25]OGV16109.1 MAG: hypothetical protein A2237_09260 [Stygiobacter sp. RIFOXYA2_FULL_38_8]OGV27398.1 MAG: hypothetical protein A2499_18265 [Stygiobacter sp. RIFOXYC12_FULL_38_8]OGV79989.1 MAG: hypothetical protein A2X65_02515 [Stygiobacter sp. GWF2_38_21]RJQ